MIEGGMPMLLIKLLLNPTGIQTECTHTTNVPSALNLEFDLDTFKNALYQESRYHIFASELILIGL